MRLSSRLRARECCNASSVRLDAVMSRAVPCRRKGAPASSQTTSPRLRMQPISPFLRMSGCSNPYASPPCMAAPTAALTMSTWDEDRGPRGEPSQARPNPVRSGTLALVAAPHHRRMMPTTRRPRASEQGHEGPVAARRHRLQPRGVAAPHPDGRCGGVGPEGGGPGAGHEGRPTGVRPLQQAKVHPLLAVEPACRLASPVASVSWCSRWTTSRPVTRIRSGS